MWRAVTGAAGLLPGATLLATPAHAGVGNCAGKTGEAFRQCVIQDQQQLPPNQVANADDDTPVCMRSTGGDPKPCQDCEHAIVTTRGDNQRLTAWACGAPGAMNPSQYLKPSCQVGEIRARGWVTTRQR
jgi:hypothetical protein